MVTQSRDSLIEELLVLKAGVTKNLPGVTVNIAGRDYTASDIVARIDEVLDAAANVRVARGALTKALDRETELRADAHGFFPSLRRIVQLRFESSPAELAEFGIAPKKERTRPTTEQKLVIGAKIRATRVARGTRGPKQKKAIRGDVTGVVVTPVREGDPPEE